MTVVNTNGDDQSPSSSSPLRSATDADFQRTTDSRIIDGRDASDLRRLHIDPPSEQTDVRPSCGLGQDSIGFRDRHRLRPSPAGSLCGAFVGRPVAEVMTFPVHVVDRETAEDDVVLEMLEFGVHQLPVVDGEAVIGMVSDMDLLGAQRRSPFHLRRRIDCAGSSADLAEIGQSLPQAAVDMWKAGLDAEHIGLWSSALTDRLTARLLDICVDHLGPAPAEWAWLALGSLGRREQASRLIRIMP